MKCNSQPWETWCSKKTTMYSCYSLQSMNCEGMEVARQRHNEPIWMILVGILYVWCLVFYRQAMRSLKGGRLFEYMRWESVFFILAIEALLGACNMRHSSQSWETWLKKKSYHVQLLLIAMDQYRCGMEVHNQRNHLISPCPSLCKHTADLKSS